MVFARLIALVLAACMAACLCVGLLGGGSGGDGVCVSELAAQADDCFEDELLDVRVPQSQARPRLLGSQPHAGRLSRALCVPEPAIPPPRSRSRL